jgi:secreted PhoX family phosphatase
LRRRVVLAGLAVTGLPGAALAQTSLAQPSSPSPPAPLPAANPQAATEGDMIGQGFSRYVIAEWGDALLTGAPHFTPGALTADAASTQFPYDAVITGLVAPPQAQDGIARLVAVFANPTAPARMLFPGGVDQPAIAGAMQGATILNLQLMNHRWTFVAGGFQSRRINDGTLCQISGPAAAAIGDTGQGLLGPQAGCVTPWGTALFAEGDASAWLARLPGTGLGFDDPANAPKFGWVAEVDPLDPSAFPMKRTALGRFPRAGIAAAALADGRPVLFMTQDDPAGLLFRFIAASAATDGTALDSGTLSVAQIQDNVITWADLPSGNAALVGTIGAAKNAGGSAFDAPAGLAIDPKSGMLYLACRGNAARGQAATNALNPRAGDDNGHVLTFQAPGNDFSAKSFTGDLAIAAGNPASASFTQYTPGSAAWLRRPTTLGLDGQGQLWIGTDQNGDTSATADGLFIMQTQGPSKYLLTTAYLAPAGAAIGSAAFAGDTTITVARHPGATPGATMASPATRWPTLRPDMPPQTTVMALVSA